MCALLLAVGVVAPGGPSHDHGATEAVAATPITRATKQTSPLVLIATAETAAVRRGRHRVRPVGRQAGGHRRGRRPAPRPGGGSGPRARHRRLRPEPAVQVDERLARMAIEIDVLVGHFRY